MPVLRTALGLTADCAVCRRWFQDGVFDGTSTQLIHAMRAADWTTQPVVCAECATKMHVWRNEGQPSDKDPKRRKVEKVAATASRRRRSIDEAKPIPSVQPVPARVPRRRRTLI